MEKLIIKIKMPPAGSELRFECPTCKKSFSSGKGLGGHKRVHLRTTAARKKKSYERTSSELQIIRHPGNNAENIHPCPVCQQPWPSVKSLHGHMRKHRDRNWRGMKPPTPQVVENGVPLLPASNAVALLEGSKSADQSGGDKLALVVASDVETSGRAERRRRRHGKAPMEMIQGTDKDSISVAYELMALSTGESRREEGFEPKKRKLELEKSGAVVLGGGHGFPGPEVAGNSSRGNNSLVVHKMAIRAQKKFVCNICKKPFKTYQALGGHKSHHIPTVGEEDKSAAGDQCPTGEAPGGDRPRCSGLPPSVNESPSCPGGDKRNDNHFTVFSFDLNELPPPEDTGF